MESRAETENRLILHAEKSEILRYLGYHGQESLCDDDSLVTSAINRGTELARPRCVSRYFAYSGGQLYAEHSTGTGTGIILPGADINAFLQGSEGCVIMAVTIGAEIDMELRWLQRRSMIEAVTLDAVASTLIENAADLFEAQIGEQLGEKGKFIKGRFSPGYGDFPIEFQQQIFRLLDIQARIGVALTDTNLMIPMKSITSLIGVFERRNS